MPINAFDSYLLSWTPNTDLLKRPIYVSIAEQLEADITSGRLKPQTKLPPQRELADFLGINFTTVTRAYKECERKGLVYGVIGRGTFVAQNAAQSVAISTDNLSSEIIDLGLVSSFEESNALASSALRRISRQRFEELVTYDHPLGLPEHRQAGARWVNALGAQTDAEHIAVVSGSQNALVIALFALFTPGSRIAVDTYTFSNFIELAKLFQIHLVSVRGDRFGMLPEDLDDQCRYNRVDGLYLSPSCGNPTTTMMSEARKQDLAQVIKARNLRLIEDDMHAFLTAGAIDDYKGPLSRLVSDASVYVCGTSKSICSGLRVAFLLYPNRFRERIQTAVYNVNVKTSGIDAELVADLIYSGKAKEIVDMKRRLAASAEAIFEEVLPGAAPAGHPLSFFRWLPVADSRSGTEIELELLEGGVRIYHSDRFLTGARGEKNFIRIALPTAATNGQLKKGLEIIRSWMV